jgi:cell division protein FtsB
MNEEQQKILRNFEVRIRQTLFLCDRLRKENANLQSQLAEQASANDSLKNENVQLQLKYDNLKVARMIAVSRDDFKDTKNRLSELVREVEKCIASLNE